MAASNQYTIYASTGVAGAALTAGIKLILPLSGNFQISEIGTLLDNASAASTHVLTLKVQNGDGTVTTTGVTLTAAGETDGKLLVRRCDVKIDVVNSKITVNGVETAIASGVSAAHLEVTTGDADATGICYLLGMCAGNAALAPTANFIVKTS